MSDDTAICATCGARVPLDLIAAHLTEHHPELRVSDVADAPVIDLTGEDE
jgi:hypothetical protein